MKTRTIVIIILIALFLFSARNYIKELAEPLFNGEESQFTEEQQSAIDSFKDGASNIFNLFKGGLFSLSELADLGILDKDNPLQSLGELIDNDERVSITDIDISSLNLEHLSDEQKLELLDVFTGEKTMTELISGGSFTLKDFQDMGLFDAILDNMKKSGE